MGVPTSARLPNGGIVERSIRTPFEKTDFVILNTRESDFSTTNIIVNKINETFGNDVAKALDPVSIAIEAPIDTTQRVSFLSMVENLEVSPAEPPARIVINSRTGTVVISRQVKVTAAAVSHGTISVSVARQRMRLVNLCLSHRAILLEFKMLRLKLLSRITPWFCFNQVLTLGK